MQLKREMLITLSKKDTDLYPNDKEKQQLIYNRYKAFELPVKIFMIKILFLEILFLILVYKKKLEEAEWIGLKPWEAITKLKHADEKKAIENIRPLKDIFAEETLERLNLNDEDAKELLKDPKRYYLFDLILN